jgi:hypothetical protein
MANMFKTIQAEGGSNGPEFLSDHPDPGNRYARITDEAKHLHVDGNGNTGQFQAMQARIRGMGKEYTAEEIARGQTQNGRSAPTGTSGRTAVRVDPPSSSMRTYTPANFLRVSVPSNWQQVENTQSGVTYAPTGAFFQAQGGGTAFTHGIEFGVAQGATGNLQRDSASLLNSFARGNPDLRQQGGFKKTNVGGRSGLTTQLSNVSEVTGQQEYVNFTTTYLQNGNLLYMIGVAPSNEAGTYDRAFAQIRSSLQLADR